MRKQLERYKDGYSVYCKALMLLRCSQSFHQYNKEHYRTCQLYEEVKFGVHYQQHGHRMMRSSIMNVLLDKWITHNIITVTVTNMYNLLNQARDYKSREQCITLRPRSHTAVSTSEVGLGAIPSYLDSSHLVNHCADATLYKPEYDYCIMIRYMKKIQSGRCGTPFRHSFKNPRRDGLRPTVCRLRSSLLLVFFLRRNINVC
jgi:hypothetical protein